MALESDVEDPSKSPILSKNTAFIKDHHVSDYFCDSMRMAISGTEAFDLDQILELDMDVHHHQAAIPIASLSTMADSLPGLGIVAAVLGVVITMGALGGPPEEIGHKVAAALVGTFLGILLCYGLVGPIAANMAKIADDEHAYLYVLRVLMISFLKGTAPILAVEVARRAIPGHLRPSFVEVEKLCRGGGEAAAAAPATEAAIRRRIGRGHHGKPAAHHHRKEKSLPRGPSRGRLEGRLRRFRHRDDGIVHCSLALKHQQTGKRSDRRIL